MPPAPLPNKWQVQSAENQDEVAGVRSGAFYWAVQACFLLSSPDPRENGQQQRWKEYICARYYNTVEKPPVIKAIGSARFHESVDSMGPLVALNRDIVEFLAELKEKKGELGNLELNVDIGAKDMPTQIEAAIGYIFAFEIAFPSLALKKKYDDMWEMSLVYDSVEKKLEELAIDVRPLVDGVEDYLTVTLRGEPVYAFLTVDEETGYIRIELFVDTDQLLVDMTVTKRPTECLFGGDIKRPPQRLIQPVRRFLCGLSPAHLEQAYTLAARGVVELLATFRRFASTQLSSQDGALTLQTRWKYGKRAQQSVPCNNDSSEQSFAMMKQAARRRPAARSDTIEAHVLWNFNHVDEAMRNGELEDDVFE